MNKIVDLEGGGPRLFVLKMASSNMNLEIKIVFPKATRSMPELIKSVVSLEEYMLQHRPKLNCCASILDLAYSILRHSVFEAAEHDVFSISVIQLSRC